jgi:methyl-accepting chemotaxis protein
MSFDYTSQIQQKTKELSELAKGSLDVAYQYQKNAVNNGVQVGDYQLPNVQGDTIQSLQELDLLVENLDSNLGKLNPLIDGAKVPQIPIDLETITPEDLIAAICSITAEPPQQNPIEIKPEDLIQVDFCSPESPPPPQVTMEDFKKLCEAVAPPDKPSKTLELPDAPSLDEAFKDLDTLPEDNPSDLEDRNNQLTDTLKELEKLDSYGSPTDALNDELAKSDLGKILLDASAKLRNNLGTDLVDNDGFPVIPNTAEGVGDFGNGLSNDQINDLRNQINNADLDAINPPPSKPEDKVAIDCVKIMQPIIEEAQKKGEEFGKVKTKIADIKQEAKIGSVFLSFWNTVDKTINDPQNKGLIDLAKQKTDLQKEKDNTSIINIFKRNSLDNKIKEITKKQFEILKTFKNQDFLNFGIGLFLSKTIDKLVKELSIEIDIKYEKYDTPIFTYDKSKITQKSDRRLQKIQDRLTESIKKVDVADPDGVDEIKKLQEKSDKEYEDEISNTIQQLEKIALGYTIDSIIAGGERFDFVKTKLKEIVSPLKSTFESKAKELEDLQKKEVELQEYMDNLSTTIKDSLKEQGCELPEINIPIDESGGNVDFKGIPMDASKSPNIFDIRWWRKFCVLATLVNLAPTFWPVGLILPTIPKPLFIPCPIIWQPLVVFNTPIALIVILIGQCGILPSPFVFVLNTGPIPLGPLNAKSGWFPVAIRPMCKIKDNVTSEKLPGTPEISLPLANPEDVKKQIDALKKQITENNKKIAENTAEIQRLTKENQDLLKKIQDLQAQVSAELERQKKNIQELNKALEQNAQENQELAKKLEDANKSIDDANKAVKEAEEQAKKNEKEIKDAVEAAKKAKDAAQSAAKKLDDANNKKNELVKKSESVSKQLEPVKDNPILALPLIAELASIASQVNAIQSQVASAIADAKKANEEADKAETKLQNARDEYQKTKDKIRTANNKIKEAQKKIQDLQKEQQNLLKKRGELNTKVSEAGGPTDSQLAIGTVQDKIKANNKKIGELIDNNAKLLQTNAKLQAKILELSTVLEISKTQKTKIEIDPRITALLPLYKDDLPTWERLGITNIPFLLFLTQWCAAGKNGGGFLRDPI